MKADGRMWMKIYTNELGHMTKMADMPVYGKNQIFLFRINWPKALKLGMYEGESISNQPNLFQVEIHLFFFDVIAL